MKKIVFQKTKEPGSDAMQPSVPFRRKTLPAKMGDVNRTEGGMSSGNQVMRGCEVDQVDDDRVRLCCDISRDRHRKLRLHAVTHDTTIFRVIERLIDENCAN